ncbi:MAG: transketolase family protein [Oscillospiraceae bacterium]|nr:transketolase family protein [Oscillospiraceae bacterium]
MAKKALRVAYGETLAELGAENEKIVVLDADLSNATMTKYFKEKYPERFFNMGIAEANLMGVAAGLAHSGYIPFASTFAIFGAGRAYEIVRNAIGYTHANVKLALTHSGISVGEDGGSHQSIEDIALMREIPGMTIFVPCDAVQTARAVRAAAEISGPVYIRIARPAVETITGEDAVFEPGKALILRDGGESPDLCIVATGLLVREALAAAEALAAEGKRVSVVDIHTIKPFDGETVARLCAASRAVISAEEHSVFGGLGSAVAETLAEAGICAAFGRIGILDKFGQSGDPDELFDLYRLNAGAIIGKYRELAK